MANEKDSLGDRIRRLREAAGLSQSDVATQLRARGHDVKNGANVGTWERGENRPRNIEILQDLETIFNARPGELAALGGYLTRPPLEILADPDETDSRKIWASIAWLTDQVGALQERLDALDPASVTADAEQFASAADTGTGGKVIESHGTSRRRVGPADDGGE